jgi:uncharacterized membrane protein YfcA
MREDLITLGAVLGFIGGAALTLVVGAVLFPEANYEKILPFVLIAMGAGTVLGGYAAARFVKKRKSKSVK